jgi:hypothetical protein
MGIEPTSEAWEASILPLYDARSFLNLAKVRNTRKGRALRANSISNTHHSIALPGKLFVTEAFDQVIIDDTRRLHQRVANRRSHETKPALL